MAWWPILKGHRRLASEYNKEWDRFLRNDPSTQKILEFGDDLMNKMKMKYGF